MVKQTPEEPLDLAWGAKEIGREINLNETKAFRVLEGGKVKCARKVGGKWCADRGALRAEFRGGA
jgi:hypothetical protein